MFKSTKIKIMINNEEIFLIKLITVLINNNQNGLNIRSHNRLPL